MNYTASSVKKVLEAHNTLEVRGGLGCPQDTNWTPNGNTPCSGFPASCEHTRSQTCKQTIEISERGTNRKLTILTFKFTISATVYDGFIDVNDQQLCRLIRMTKNADCPVNTDKFVTC